MIGDAPSTVGGHSLDNLADIASEEIPGDAAPGFAAVSGGHSYGWAGSESDVDLRGFHVADGRRYGLLEPPDDQLSATFASRRPGVADVDFVTYELRKFGRLVANRNVNVLETLFEGRAVLDAFPAEIEALSTAIEHHLPMDVPTAYAGLADSNRDAIIPGGDVKRALYAIRGLLAAHYVRERETIEADIRVLSETVLGETGLVDALILGKRSSPDATLDGELARRASATYEHLVEESWNGSADVAEYQTVVDRWMCDVRGWESI